MGSKLKDSAEILFRQIHPNSLQDGIPGSDRFRPTESDNNQLSTDRASMTTPQDSHALYTSTGKQSGAVFGVSVGEFESRDVACFHDPIKDDAQLPDNPSHAFGDYSLIESKKVKLTAKYLKKCAQNRGCLYLVPAGTTEKL